MHAFFIKELKNEKESLQLSTYNYVINGLIHIKIKI